MTGSLDPVPSSDSMASVDSVPRVDPTPEAVAAARTVLTREVAAAAVPEAAFGILAGSRLVDGQGTERIFRIASMTKSFTAAAVLGLSRGLIPCAGRSPHLDDLLADWLPSLGGGAQGGGVRAGAGAQPGDWAAEMTIRDALTMSTGLPTDDPWADRLESMPASQMRRLMNAPALRNFPAGAGFEYSNYGYAMLGALIEAVTGRPMAEVIGDHLLDPLGLRSTGFDVRDLDTQRFVTGYRRNANGELEPQPLTTPGAFSAIGGLASTVEDIAVWVDALIDAVASPEPSLACHRLASTLLQVRTPDDAHTRAGTRIPDDVHTMSAARAWRRVLADLQQVQRPISVTAADDHAVTAGYGYGLRCSFDTRYGATAGHSGGYPGYGLHMRWHAGTGLGIILLTNLTGFPTEAVATAALDAALAVLKTHAPERSCWPQAQPVTLLPSQHPAPEAEGTTASGTGEGQVPGASGTGEGQVPGASGTAIRSAGGRGVVHPVRPVAAFAPTALAWDRQRAAEAMIATGDDAAADAIFSANMDLDVPRAERLQVWAAARAHTGERASGAVVDAACGGAVDPACGEAVDAAGGEVEWPTALSARWEVWNGSAGPHAPEPRRGRRVEMLLNPAGEIQKLTVTLLSGPEGVDAHTPGSGEPGGRGQDIAGAHTPDPEAR